jgi:thiol-disulfide isomerase/thioredoxin
MLNSITGLFKGKKEKSSNNSSNNLNRNVSVRSPEEIEDLEKVIKIGPVALVFVHADWCGHCQTYKPTWEELESTPGRQVNMAMIHHDMVENSPTLKNAEIPGYPSVLKVYPNGKIEQYKGTNSMPNIRDKTAMLKEILTPTNTYVVSQNAKRNIGNVTIGASTPPMLPVMKGGSLYAALSQALQAAGPTAVLLAANQMLPKRAAGSSARRTRKASRRSSRQKTRSRRS